MFKKNGIYLNSFVYGGIVKLLNVPYKIDFILNYLFSKIVHTNNAYKLILIFITA